MNADERLSPFDDLYSCLLDWKDAGGPLNRVVHAIETLIDERIRDAARGEAPGAEVERLRVAARAVVDDFGPPELWEVTSNMQTIKALAAALEPPR